MPHLAAALPGPSADRRGASKVTSELSDSDHGTVVLGRTHSHSYAAIESEQVAPNVVLTRMRGHMTRLLAEQRFDQFRTAIVGMQSPAWIIEQLELTGFDPGAVTAGARWFGAFKERGGDRVVFVSPLSAARMVAASLAFAAHAKISACETLKEAYERSGLGNVEPRPSLVALIKPRAG